MAISTSGFQFQNLARYTPVDPSLVAFNPSQIASGAMDATKLAASIQKYQTDKALAAELEATRQARIEAENAKNKLLGITSTKELDMVDPLNLARQKKAIYEAKNFESLANLSPLEESARRAELEYGQDRTGRLKSQLPLLFDTERLKLENMGRKIAPLTDAEIEEAKLKAQVAKANQPLVEKETAVRRGDLDRQLSKNKAALESGLDEFLVNNQFLTESQKNQLASAQIKHLDAQSKQYTAVADDLAANGKRREASEIKQLSDTNKELMAEIRPYLDKFGPPNAPKWTMFGQRDPDKDAQYAQVRANLATMKMLSDKIQARESGSTAERDLSGQGGQQVVKPATTPAVKPAGTASATPSFRRNANGTIEPVSAQSSNDANWVAPTVATGAVLAANAKPIMQAAKSLSSIDVGRAATRAGLRAFGKSGLSGAGRLAGGVGGVVSLADLLIGRGLSDKNTGNLSASEGIAAAMATDRDEQLKEEYVAGLLDRADVIRASDLTRDQKLAELAKIQAKIADLRK